MRGIADWAAFVVIITLIIRAFGGVSQDDINRACAGKGGVIGYSDHTWGGTKGTATVVCGNHVAYRIDS